MSFFENTTSYNPLFLEDEHGLAADIAEATLMDDNEELERQILIRKLVGTYGVEEVQAMIDRGEL